MVSVIIPTYNAAAFILKTIQSVISQTFPSIEIIIIDDGSTDNTANIINELTRINSSIHYYHQQNKGVSAARNSGLAKAKGEFVVFLDSDDLLEPDFILKRVLFLQNSSFYDACSSSVQIIDENDTPRKINFLGAHDNIVEQIMLYRPVYSTCPSNYMFRRSVLEEYKLSFNEKLSSSADKFFLLKAGLYIKTGIIYNDVNARLLYRIHKKGMSQVISQSLLEDNKLFLQEVLTLPLPDPGYKHIFKFKVNYILSGGYFRMRKYGLAVYFGIRSFFYHPFLFIKQLCVA